MTRQATAVAIITWILVGLAASLAAEQVTTAPEVHHIHGLAFDRVNPDVILVATHTGLVRLAPNSAPEWIGDHRFDLMGFTAHPKQAGVFFASGHPDLVTYQREQVGNLGLLVTDDGGRTWRSISLRGQADFHAMAYSPANGGEVYGWTVAGQRGLYRITLRSGAAERLGAKGLADVLALSASPDGTPRLLAGTKAGISMSEDAGRTWRPVTGLPGGLAVSAISHHATEATRVYAYVNGPGHGLMRSRDAGATWAAVGLVSGDNPVIALAVGPGEAVAVATIAADVLWSADGGRNWQRRLARGRIPVGSR